MEGVAPLGVELETALYLIVGLQLQPNLVKLFLVPLRHNPHLHRLLQAPLQKAQHVLTSDASQILLQCLLFLASEQEGAVVDLTADECKVVIETVVWL